MLVSVCQCVCVLQVVCVEASMVHRWMKVEEVSPWSCGLEAARRDPGQRL